MIVCHDRRFIFVAVNKTASTSIHRTFREHDIVPDRLDADRPPDPRLHHVPATTLREMVGATVWNTYFKFAFVRNPWDRLVSFFHYLKRSPWVTDDTTLARQSPTFRDWVAAGRYTRQTQTAMLCSPDGQVCVDYLGRYETLRHDFDAICRTLGMRLSLPHLNAHSIGPYIEHYDPWSLVETAEVVRPDAERFGYVFGAQ